MSEKTDDTLSERRRVGQLERHITTTLLTGLVLMASWIAHSSHQTTVGVAVLQSRLDAFIEKDDLLHQNLSARVEALEDRNVNITARIRKNEDRIRDQEQSCLKVDDCPSLIRRPTGEK